MKITYIFPSRSRVNAFFKCLDNIHQLSDSGDFEIICSLDLSDEVMNNETVLEGLKSYPKVSAYYGVSTGKISACNRECQRSTGGIIILLSDDMVIIKPGFDEDIREAAKDFSGLIHFPDGFQNEKLCTFPILTKDYLAIDGWIYQPRFYSVFADNFQQELAKNRGKYKFVNKYIVEHHHYRNGYGSPDLLMEYNDSRGMYQKDMLTYIELKKEFGLL